MRLLSRACAVFPALNPYKRKYEPLKALRKSLIQLFHGLV